MIGIWPEAWLRLHERERTLDVARRRTIAATAVVTTNVAPVASGTIGAVARTPDLACC